MPLILLPRRDTAALAGLRPNPQLPPPLLLWSAAHGDRDISRLAGPLGATALGAQDTRRGLIARTFNGSTSRIEWEFPSTAVMSPMCGTMVVFGWISGGSSTERTGVSLGTTFSATPLYRIEVNGSNKWQFQIRDTASNATNLISTSTPTTGRLYGVVATCAGSGGTMRLFVDGVQEATATAPAGTMGALNRAGAGVLARGGVEQLWNGGIALAAIFPYELPAGMAAAISADPDLLFQPVTRYAKAASGGPPTANLTGTTSASARTASAPVATATANLTGTAASRATSASAPVATATRNLVGTAASSARTSTTSVATATASLTGVAGSGAHTASAPAATATAVLTGTAASRATSSSSPAVTRVYGATGVSVSSARTSSTPAVIRTTVLAGTSATRATVISSGSLPGSGLATLAGQSASSVHVLAWPVLTLRRKAAAVIRRTARTTQPLEPTGLARDNPLTVGLQRAYTYGGAASGAVVGGAGAAYPLWDGARERAVPISQDTQQASAILKFEDGVLGRYIYGGHYFAVDDAPALTQKMTALIFVSVHNASATDFVFGATTIGAGSDYNWGLMMNASGGVSARLKNSSGTAVTTSTLQPFTFTPKVFGMTYDGATLAAFTNNGALRVTASQTGDIQQEPLQLTHGGWDVANRNVVYYAAFVWNRVLSSSEIASVSRNPWQLFRGSVERAYTVVTMPAPAGLTPASATSARGATQPAYTYYPEVSLSGTSATSTREVAAVGAAGVTAALIGSTVPYSTLSGRQASTPSVVLEAQLWAEEATATILAEQGALRPAWLVRGVDMEVQNFTDEPSVATDPWVPAGLPLSPSDVRMRTSMTRPAFG